MAGKISVNQVQLGDSSTATNNFVWQTNVDGTCKLARGNVGATTQDILTVDAAGLCGITRQIVESKLTTVATGTTLIPDDDTIPQNIEGDQFLSVSITPKNAASTLKVEVEITVNAVTGSSYSIVGLFKDSDANALVAAKVLTGSTGNQRVVLTATLIPGSLSTITFKVRAGGTVAGLFTVNGYNGTRYLGGAMASLIRVTEIA